MMATQLAAQMVGSFGMAGSLISFDAVSHGPIGGANLVAKVLADERRQAERRGHPHGAEGAGAGGARGEPGRPLGPGATRSMERDELIRDEILAVIHEALAARA